MKQYAITIILLLAGCDSPPPMRFKVAIVRPDGVVHREFEHEAITPPIVEMTRGGGGMRAMSGLSQIAIAPHGWLIDVRHVGEPLRPKPFVLEQGDPQ
jgi:hypothetical protein